MKKKIGYLLFGTAFGIYNFYPSLPNNKSTIQKESIQNYVQQNKLQEAKQLLVYKGKSFTQKQFYYYGIQQKMQGFNFNNTYVKKQQSQIGDVKHIYLIFNPTTYLCGHTSIQHGGATAAILIQKMANLGLLNCKDNIETSKIGVQYKKPIRKDHNYVLESQIKKKQPEQICINSEIKNLQTGQLVVKSDAIYKIRPSHRQQDKIMKKLLVASSSNKSTNQNEAVNINQSQNISNQKFMKKQ